MTELPRIYESDYNKAVINVHNGNYNLPIVAIPVRTEQWYEQTALKDNLPSLVDKSIVVLSFKATQPHLINHIRYWKLQDEIILIPDNNG